MNRKQHETRNPKPETGIPESGNPEIVLIAAVAEKNRVIGNGLRLPWHIPEDLQHFKRHTLGNPLIMGKNTFISLCQDFGGPLPNRRTLVLTSDDAFPDYPDIETFPSVDAVMEELKDEPLIYIGGGSTVYAHFLPLAHRMELTLIEGDYEGDIFFPPFEHLIGTDFTITNETQRNGFRFVTYHRPPH